MANSINTWNSTTDATFLGAIAEAMKLNQSRNGQAITSSQYNIALNETDGCLFVGTGGNVQVRLTGTQNTLTYYNIPDGTFMPIRIDRIYSGTTASNLIFQY